MTPFEIKKLYGFLKVNNAVESYMKNLAKFLEHNGSDTTSFFLSKHMESAIIGAFTWVETIEGIKYWLSLNNEWNKYISEKHLIK